MSEPARLTPPDALPDGRLAYDVVDVFTATAFAGNPLAVVHGAEALTTGRLQRLAAEFNLSETAFPLTPTPEQAGRGVTYRLRIFTPRAELPFAGHPSVGTAWLLAHQGRVAPGRLVQACGAGELPLDVEPDGGAVTLTGGEPQLGPRPDPGPVAAAVGLTIDDVAPVGGVGCAVAGTGNPFVVLFVRPDALDRAVSGASPVAGATGVHVVAWPDGVTADGIAGPVRVRLFSPEHGITEDPATGSAALGLAVLAVDLGLLPPDGPSSFTVSQGEAMGRPSTLRTSVEAVAGRALSATVAGTAVPVASGTIRVPG